LGSRQADGAFGTPGNGFDDMFGRGRGNGWWAR
ncbi:MAG: hypothetical protein JWQ43_2633, partial [Glaciihabitans sp.]|nr:hypothetical protein [Glaciihabitans sp.]